MSVGPIYGDPFLLPVWHGNLNGALESADFDGVIGVDFEANIIRDCVGDVQHYGGTKTVYMCIPIAVIHTDDPGDEDDSTNAPGRVVTTEVTDNFQRMARTAAALGGTK